METKKEQHVDPWHAEAAEGEDTIDYDKLISKKTLYACLVANCMYSYSRHIIGAKLDKWNTI